MFGRKGLRRRYYTFIKTRRDLWYETARRYQAWVHAVVVVVVSTKTKPEEKSNESTLFITKKMILHLNVSNTVDWTSRKTYRTEIRTIRAESWSLFRQNVVDGWIQSSTRRVVWIENHHFSQRPSFTAVKQKQKKLINVVDFHIKSGYYVKIKNVFILYT